MHKLFLLLAPSNQAIISGDHIKIPDRSWPELRLSLFIRRSKPPYLLLYLFGSLFHPHTLLNRAKSPVSILQNPEMASGRWGSPRRKPTSPVTRSL
ncbi:hypothetical protein N431DRAFT_142292 [Stipitochalara longipes BDJ]|nr:hypothetical protein N431DRAFT_142292 [Stipitochalara longipes BDJ]